MNRTIPYMLETLSFERASEMVRYDPDAGAFYANHKDMCRGQKRQVGDPVGCRRGDGYLLIKIDGVLYLAHRIAWFLMTGSWPTHGIDHRDTDKSNNRWLNLREASQSQNSANSNLRRNNTSGLKGVSWDMAKKKWRAAIVDNGRTVFLGRFSTAEDAHAAYFAAATRLHGEFARAA